MTRYSIFKDGKRIDVEAARTLEPGSAEDTAVTLEAAFTFDGHAEYEEYRVDGELVDVRVTESPTSSPRGTR